MSQHRKHALGRLAALCLGTSALATPGIAAVIDYPDGSTNTTPIVLTDSSTQLQVLTGTATDNSVISQSGGTFGVEKIGNGTLILDSSVNYGGATVVSAGTLRLGVVNSIASSNALVIGGGATFDVNGNTTRINNLSSGDPPGTPATLAIGTGTLTINQTINGGFTGNVTGTGALVYNGPASLSLNTGTFNGAITVNGGTLNAGVVTSSDLTINGGTFAVTPRRSLNFGRLSGTGGTLDLSGSFLIFSGPGDELFSGVIADSVSSTGQFTSNTNGTLTLTGASTASSAVVINSGTLQFGNGGTTGGFANSNITDDGSLIFNRSDSYTYNGKITGTGTLTKAGSGTLTLRDLAVFGGVFINGGTLRLISSTSSLLPAGNITNNSALIVSFGSTATTYGGVILGTGSVTAAGDGAGPLILTGASTYTGGTTIAGGTLQLGTGGSLPNGGALAFTAGVMDLNGHTQTVGALSGTGGAILLGSGQLTTTSNSNTVFAGGISGSGTLVKAGSGTLALTGNDNRIGRVVINGGTLLIGDGFASGRLAGDVTNNATLAFDYYASPITFAGIVSGPGALSKRGAGSVTLSGISTYTGATTVSAGTLTVTGSISASNVTVQSGATLSGTGRVGPTIIATGGTLTPGSTSPGTAPGTLSVAGNLALAAGTNFAEAITPTAAALTSVSGTAAINGTFTANFVSSTYTVGQRYTILTASDGISGAFTAMAATRAPTYVQPRLSYDANNVYLNLDPVALSSSQGGASANQSSGASAIDKAVAGGAVPPAGFTALYMLSGAALNAATDQISGQVGSNVANSVGQGSLSFVTMSAPGGGSTGGSFAPGSAYNDAGAPRRAKLGSGETRVWGAAYGGHVGLGSDTASGAAGLSANNVGMIGGIDLQVGNSLLMGISGGFGRQDFRSGNGTGTSDDTMIGLYARQDAGRLYLTAAFGLGWHQVTTKRTITVSGTDVLQGKQDATDYGLRAEAGWRVSSRRSPLVLSPYVALAADSFETPAYAETVVSGSSTFALSYAAHTSTLGRSELGARLDRDYTLGSGILSASAHAAWAHRLGDTPFTQASFQALPTASFVVRGVRPDSDTGLLGLDLDIKQKSGLFFGVSGEAQVGKRTTILQGMGHLGWRW